MKFPVLRTESLSLVPHSAEQILALITDPANYVTLTGFEAAPGLRDFFVGPEVSPDFLDSLRADEETNPWRMGFAIVEKSGGLAIGSGGFRGPPDSDGFVEIAYGIVPAYQGRGFATQAANALTALAFSAPGVNHVCAHTLPNTSASTAVLTKCGFAFVGEHMDPEDGRVWRWEKRSRD